jgi:phage shock protein A
LYQTDLVKIRQSYAEVTATQRRLLKQKEQADAVAMDWYKRAQLALEKGNDALAKEALTRRQMAVDEATTLQSQITIQTTSIDKLYEGMQILEKKILEAKSKKEQMVARARTAQASQKVNDLVSGVTGKTSMDAFKRMEDKVEALEAAAEVSAEMGMMGALSAGSDIEQQFKLLEASTSVDDELAKMKQNLLTGSSTGSSSSSSSSSNTTGSTGSSTASSSSNSGTPPIDDELERLKREAGL